jgi:hypothetical protein
MELPADAEPEHEGGSSRRQFIRRLAAISAGLSVAAPLARGVAVTEESLAKSPPPKARPQVTSSRRTVASPLQISSCLGRGFAAPSQYQSWGIRFPFDIDLFLKAPGMIQLRSIRWQRPTG